jgi:hypothetical protein
MFLDAKRLIAERKKRGKPTTKALVLKKFKFPGQDGPVALLG